MRPLPPAGSLLLAVAVAHGLAVVALWMRRRDGGMLAAWCAVPLILASPLIIPRARVGLRAACAVVSADLAFKIVDAARRRGRGIPPRDDLGRLIPFPVFAVVAPEHRRRLRRPEPRGPHLLRVALGVAGAVGAVLALRAISGVPAIRSSFALNHAAMLLAFVAAIESISRALHGLEHLAGYDTTPIIRNAYLSRTVAEFWRRYNHRIHDWLDRHVFRPAGGRRAPVRSVVLVFLVSGAIHELMFGIATSRFTGYQMAFFALQAPAVLASARIERLARRGGPAAQVVAHGSTLLYLAATSVLFFDGVHNVFPFIYASPSPLR